MTKIWNERNLNGSQTNAYIISDDMNDQRKIRFYSRAHSCESLAGRFPETTIEIKTRTKPVDHFDASLMMMVSDQLKQLLEKHHVHCEFFPVDVIYKKKIDKSLKYYFCNIIDCVDAIDYQKGKYTYWEASGNVKDVVDLAILEDKIDGHPLLRIQGVEHLTFVSDGLAADLERSGMNVGHFVGIKDWKYI